jgi:hypothetical protein
VVINMVYRRIGFEQHGAQFDAEIARCCDKVRFYSAAFSLPARTR